MTEVAGRGNVAGQRGVLKPTTPPAGTVSSVRGRQADRRAFSGDVAAAFAGGGGAAVKVSRFSLLWD